MAEFKPRVFPQILGDMIATIVANSPITDTNPGSVIRTILEASAQEDDEQYFQMLNIIKAYSLDTVTGADLDDRGFEYGVVRLTSVKATSKVTLGDSSFTKIFTGVYSGLNGPLATDSSINGDSSTGFAVSGSIIIGRGTPNVETVAYSSITQNLNYVTFNLSAGLAFDHGTDETIIYSQGGNRLVSAGTVVNVPVSDLSEKIDFTIDSDSTILDGEDSLTNVNITAVNVGSDGNVPLGSIDTFDSPPFSTATVTNPARVTNGRDDESDQEYRDRIKDVIQSLSRGTARSISAALAGLVSEDDAKRVVSATVVEPNLLPSIVKVYIDDGTGFIPAFANVGEETVVLSATGGEQFLSVDNVPMVKAFLESVSEQTYIFAGGEILNVVIGDDTETFTFQTSDFADPALATSIEVQTALNKATLFEGRVSESGNKVRIFARRNVNDAIQVTGGSANNILNFPITKVETAHLYKVSDTSTQFLSKDGSTASIETVNAETYDFSVGRRNLCVVVNGQIDSPIQIIFETTDFASPSAGTAEEVAAAINGSSAGFIAASATNDTTVKLFSRYENNSGSMLRVLENFDQIYNEESATNTDRTTELSAPASTAQIFVALSDYLYVGFTDTKFNSIFVDLTVVSSHDVELLCEYWNGSGWTTVGVLDETVGFTQDGHIFIPTLHNWATTAVETNTRYWFRLQRTAVTVTTNPEANLVRVCSSNAILAFPLAEKVGSDSDYTLNRFIGQIELQTPLTINDKVVLGTQATRAFVISADQTYDFSTNDILYIDIDGAATQSYNFVGGDFLSISAGTAAEVVIAVNANFDGVTASVINGTKVKIQSNTWNNGSIQITTGATDANAELGFPTTLASALVSHVPAVESVIGPYNFAINDSMQFAIDGDTANPIIVPCYHEGIVTTAGSTTTFTDTSLIAIFTNDEDLIGFDCEWITVATPPPAVAESQTVSAYNSATGLVTVSSAYTGTAVIGDTYQLMPTSAKEVVSFWNNRKITQINSKVEIVISTNGTKVQIASLAAGQDASVLVVGGGGNSELSFSTLIVEGVSAYRYWTGLAQLAQWTIDGVASNPDTYPGIRAAGNQIEIIEPVIVKVIVIIDITAEEGVSVSSLSNDVKSEISSYVNGLGVGDDVIISDIIVAAKGVIGISDAIISIPASNTAVADNELARINETDITVS